MKHTEKDNRILRYLALTAFRGLPAPTARQIRDAVCDRDVVTTWAGPSLRRMHLQGYVKPASKGRLRNITWKITDDGLERLTRDNNAELRRLLFEQTPGTEVRA